MPKEAPARSGRIPGISGDSCSAASLQLIDGKPFILNCTFGEAPSFLPGKPFGPGGFQPVPHRFIRFALLNLLRGWSDERALRRGAVDGHMTVDGQPDLETRAAFHARWTSAGRFPRLKYRGTAADA